MKSKMRATFVASMHAWQAVAGRRMGYGITVTHALFCAVMGGTKWGTC